MLYLTRKNGKWKLYDHRDPLLPLSEVGYFAAYSAAPLAISDSYYDLSIELESIYADELQPAEQQAARSLLSFNRYKYHPPVVPMAHNFTAAYLLLYEDIPSLRALTGQFDDSTFAGAHRIKAELALLENDPALATEHVERLMASVGWHPSAALIAGRAANTPEERQRAAAWLRRSLMLAPQHATSITQFARVASDADYQQLFEDFGGQPNAKLMALRFAEQFEDYQQLFEDFGREPNATLMALRFAEQLNGTEELARVAGLLEANAEFSLAAGILRFREAENSENVERGLAVAGELLKNPDLSELQNASQQPADDSDVSGVVNRLWNALLFGLREEATFELAVAAAPDKIELTRRLRDEILTFYPSTDWAGALRLFESLPEDSTLAGEDETVIARGVCKYRLQDYATAYELLLPIITQNWQSINSIDSAPEYAFVSVTALANSAVELGKSLELAEVLQDPETAFVVLQSCLQLDKQAAEMESLNEWYRQFSDAPGVWLALYEAELSYARGEWEEADTHLARAIQDASDDVRFDDEALPPLLSNFSPFSDSPSDWFDLRVERALDAGRFAVLWNKLKAANQVNQVPDSLKWVLHEIDDPALLREVADLVLTVPSPAAFAINLEARRLYEEKIGNIDAALELALEGASAVEQDGNDNNSVIPSVVRLMSIHGKFEQIDKLAELAKSADEKASVAVLRAQAAGDATLLLSALEKYVDRAQFTSGLEQYWESYKLRLWFDSIDRVAALQRGNLFEAINAKYPVSLRSLAVDYAAAGTLGLAEPASAHENAIVAALAKASGTQPQPLDTRSFPKAVGAWSCPTSAGALIAIAYDAPAVEAPASPALESLRQNYSGLLCLVLQQSPELRPPTDRLRLLSAELGEQLPIAKAYFDDKSNQWFSHSGWQADLREAAPHGINRRAPVDAYLPSAYVDSQFSSDAGQLFVSIGLIVEAVPAKRQTARSPNSDSSLEPEDMAKPEGSAELAELDDSALEGETQLYELLQTPKLLPLLPPGTWVIE